MVTFYNKERRENSVALAWRVCQKAGSGEVCRRMVVYGSVRCGKDYFVYVQVGRGGVWQALVG